MGKQLSISLVFDNSYLLNQFSFFDIGQAKEFFDSTKSKQQFSEVYHNFIRDELESLVSLTTTAKTPLSAYFSGTFLKLLQDTDKDMIDRLKAATQEHLELLTGSYTNSLSVAFSLKSAVEEINKHNNYLESLFSVRANKSYLFENIYSNDISKELSSQGISTSFAGAISWYLDGKADSKILDAQCCDNYSILLPDQDLGDSVFNNLNQKNHFLQFDISSLMNLNGIESAVEKLKRRVPICSLDEQISTAKTEKKYNIKTPIMSGLKGLSLDNLRSNALQNSAIKHYYSLKSKVNKCSDSKLVEAWLLLGHSEYFLQMGQNNTDATYDIYSNYMSILNDLELRLDH